MKELFSLFRGALTLRDETFRSLREYSDVFLRGVLVVLIVGLVAGAFEAAANVLNNATGSENPAAVSQAVIQSVDQSGTMPAAYRSMIEDYVREGVSMVIEIGNLPPQAGDFFRPVARFLEWLGQTISTPFSLGYLGWMLLAGLLVHLTSYWLGGRGTMAQMLGLSALAFAPKILNPLSTILVWLESATGSGAFGSLNFVVGWVLFFWGIAIFVKATCVAQGLSIGRALLAAILAFVIVAVIDFVLFLMMGAGLGSLIAIASSR